MAEILKGGQSPSGERDKLVTLIHGLGGAGKTTLALTWPSPIFMFNCDRPAKSLIEKLPPHYEVHYEMALRDVEAVNQGMAARYIMAFDALFREALAGGKGTIFIDGWDIFWEYVKLAKVPGLSDDTLPRQYEPANSYMFSFARRAVSSPLEVVLTTISEKPWEGATKQADYYVPGGWKHRDRFITCQLYAFTPERRERAPETPYDRGTGQTHQTYIGMNKLNEQTVGSVVANLSYKMLYRMTFGRLPDDHEQLWVPGQKVGAEKQ